MKANCITCAEVEIEPRFSDQDGATLIPTSEFKTLQSLGKYYKSYNGRTYFEETGMKMTDSFEKQVLALSHADIDDDQTELNLHSIGRHEVWTDNP